MCLASSTVYVTVRAISRPQSRRVKKGSKIVIGIDWSTSPGETALGLDLVWT